jgi:hypothetical protein
MECGIDRDKILYKFKGYRSIIEAHGDRFWTTLSRARQSPFNLLCRPAIELHHRIFPDLPRRIKFIFAARGISPRRLGFCTSSKQVASLQTHLFYPGDQSGRLQPQKLGGWFGVTRSAVSDWTNHRDVFSLSEGLELQLALARQSPRIAYRERLWHSRSAAAFHR